MRRPPLDMVLVLDISSSMSGSPSRAVWGAARSIAAKHLTGPHDRLSVVLFNTTVHHVLRRAHAKHVDWAALDAQHGDGRGGLACRGVTALWDGVHTALQAMCHRRPDTRPDGSKHRLPHPYVMVLTDGGDNASSPAVTDMVGEGLLRKPSQHGFTGVGMAHLHVQFLTVGADAKACVLRGMQLAPADKLPGHIALLSADDGAGIAALLAQAEKRVAQHITVMTTTTTRTTVTRSRASGGGKTSKTSGSGSASKGGGVRHRDAPRHKAAHGADGGSGCGSDGVAHARGHHHHRQHQRQHRQRHQHSDKAPPRQHTPHVPPHTGSPHTAARGGGARHSVESAPTAGGDSKASLMSQLAGLMASLSAA